MNQKVAYTLRTHPTTGERHLFTGKFTPNGPSLCNMSANSACKGVVNTECSKLQGDFDCRNEQEARDLCAKLGRSVCANCINELYKTV